MSVYRTFLFAPGNHPRKVEKSLTLEADAVILDLEDAVAVAEKVTTRAPVRAALDQPRTCLAYVRVNPFDSVYCYADLVAVVCEHLDGIILPKVESSAQLIAVDWLLTALEAERDMVHGSIDVIPIIETALGMEEANAVATASKRVKRLAFGAGDYTLDTSMVWTREETELTDVRCKLVRVSRASGLQPPLDTVWIHIKDDKGFVASCERVRDLGFQGKMCIYPTQVAQANRVFTPSDDEVAHAEKIVAAFEAAEAAGSASIQVDGYFVDYPIVEKARRTLAVVSAINKVRAPS